MIADLTQRMREWFMGSRSAAPSRSARRRLEVEGLEERALPSGFTFSSLPTPRHHLAAVTAADGRIYTVGGLNAQNQAVANVEVYDPVTDIWSTAASLPTPRYDLAAAVGSDGRIYAIGGTSSAGRSLSLVEAYNPITDTWTTVGGLGAARDQASAVTGTDGKIYVFGGHQFLGGAGATDRVLKSVEVYTLGTNTWTAAADMATGRANFAAVGASDGRIFVLGGGSETVEAYNPTTNAWAAQANMPTSRSFLNAGATPDGTIYALGGINAVNGALSTNIEAYNPVTNSWSIVGGLANGRAAGAGVTGRDGRIYVLGGYAAGAVGGVEGFTADIANPQTNQNQLFVNRLYQDLLRRPAEAAGLAYWTLRLDQGSITREGLVNTLLGADDYRTAQVEATYQRLLGRSADTAGLSGGRFLLANGLPISVVETLIMASREYELRNGLTTDDAFLTHIYQTVLGRAIDTAGRETFGRQLRDGQTRFTVTIQLALSPEGVRTAVNRTYQRFLGRPADPAGLNTFVGVLTQGLSESAVISGLVSSLEYYRLA